MKIRTLAQLSIGVVLAGMLSSGVVVLHTGYKLEQIASERDSIFQLTQGVGQLRLLAQETLLYAEERPEAQWHAQYETLSGVLKRMHSDDRLEAMLLTGLRDDLDRANRAFADFITTRNALAASPQSATLQSRRDMLLGQLSVRLQSLLSRAARLRQISADADVHVRRDTVDILIALLGILTVVSVGSGMLIIKRMANPIARLRMGTAIIGSGKLDYRVGTAARDEIGELSREIDKMAGRLKEVTASRDEFERETDERLRAEARMNYLAHHDALTGLPNRVLLEDRIEQAMAHSVRSGKKVALLFLDLDRFKNINDACGHVIGDAVLQSVAERLRAAVRNTDTVSRLGSDEFVLLSELDDQEAATELGNKLKTVMKHPVRVEANEFNLTFSIGVALYPDHATDREALMKNANIAMYYAKESGRNMLAHYSRDMSDRAEYRNLMESNLRRALKFKEFQLHYQPQVNIRTGEIVGLEALLRWHTDGVWIEPSSFVPVAEETGLMAPLGEWVIHEACGQIRRWQDMGLPQLPVAVNVSAVQLAQDNFAERVFDVIAATGIEPHNLKLELTESMIMGGPANTMALMEALHQGGVQLAIDDFGTGYSSLSYLKRFPVETLKIDQSFIRGLPGDKDDAAITSAIIRMARSLRLKVVAEGVESAAQMNFLRDNDCMAMQGYLFSVPLAAKALETFLRSHYARFGPARMALG
ncbi:hypothetical protein BH11PSE11_BH11PSE11_22250 [soil metagenome]